MRHTCTLTLICILVYDVLYHDTTLYPTTYYDTIFQALRLDIEAEVVARHALQHPFLPPETVARAEVAAVSAPRAEAC